MEHSLLDGLQVNGRWDVMHVPSCSGTATRVHCKAKSGPQNPGRLFDGRFVVPPLVVPQTP